MDWSLSSCGPSKDLYCEFRNLEMIRVNFSLNAPFEGVANIQMTDQCEFSFKYSNFDSLDAFSFRRTFFSIRRNNLIGIALKY